MCMFFIYKKIVKKILFILKPHVYKKKGNKNIIAQIFFLATFKMLVPSYIIVCFIKHILEYCVDLFFIFIIFVIVIDCIRVEYMWSVHNFFAFLVYIGPI